MEENFPPNILVSSLEPPGTVVRVADIDCPTTFRVGRIEDLNAGDTLFVRWFIDYDAARADRQVIQKARSLAPQGDQTVRQGDTFTFGGPNARNLLDLLRPDDLHVLEVVVSDVPFTDGPEDPEPNRTVPGDADHLDLRAWILQFPEGTESDQLCGLAPGGPGEAR